MSVTTAARADDPDDGGWWTDPDDKPAQVDPPDTPDGEEPKAEDPKAEAEEPVAVVVVEKPAEAASPKKDERSSKLPPSYYWGDKKFLKPIKGEEPPPGYEKSKRNRRGVWIGGIALHGPMYLFTVVSTALMRSSEHDDSILRAGSVPLIGPFIVAGNESIDGGLRGLVAFFGIGQAAGFAMILGGSITRVPVWRRSAQSSSSSAVAVDVTPAPTGGSVSVSF